MNCNKLNSGFTIIETVLSLVIFLILFLAISTLITATAINTHAARDVYQTIMLAQKRIEELKSTSTIEEGIYYHNYDNYILEEEIKKIEKYKGRVYKIVIKIYKNDEVIESLETIKVIR
ncbi:type IV pilus modification PilV family protein [Lutispora thermophila]|uniref:Prepilin-type N-terminal cleavage/methylation domain-containing protein n=1 Tax=Lutispora thermophila DSM 19022 TaxID=1122184 RepID=A0A1M6F405_9FIRM|nr:prepilin-type N-terminal cleavage/methylation domain-containing protein [Lutispora thermophila]SHI92400.1 hypothetical protein SAMN02745176_01805 [Lutispora thermophila DSM 19022]